MKYALFTYHFIGPIEDEEEAGEIAVKIEQAVSLNLVAARERYDVSETEMEDLGIRSLGVSVAVFDELPVTT